MFDGANWFRVGTAHNDDFVDSHGFRERKRDSGAYPPQQRSFFNKPS